MALTKAVRRWRDGVRVSGDADYCTRLETLSSGSVRRNFNPYLDIPWDSPEFKSPRDVTRQFDIRNGARQRHRWDIARIRERWHVGRNWQRCHWIIRCDRSPWIARAPGSKRHRGHQGREQRNSPPSPTHTNSHPVSPLPSMTTLSPAKRSKPAPSPSQASGSRKCLHCNRISYTGTTRQIVTVTQH